MRSTLPQRGAAVEVDAEDVEAGAREGERRGLAEAGGGAEDQGPAAQRIGAAPGHERHSAKRRGSRHVASATAFYRLPACYHMGAHGQDGGHRPHRQRDPLRARSSTPTPPTSAASSGRSAWRSASITVIPDEVDLIAAEVARLSRGVRRGLHLGRRRPDPRRRDDRGRGAGPRGAGRRHPRLVAPARGATRRADRINEARLKMAEVPEGAELIADERAHVPDHDGAGTSTSCPACPRSSGRSSTSVKRALPGRRPFS